MLNTAYAILSKDLRLISMRSEGTIQAILLGLLLIFLFSLGQGTSMSFPPQQAAAIFWISSLFCQVLLFHQLHQIEKENDARDGLISASIPLAGVWLGKAAAGFCMLLLAQCLFFLAAIVFLGQTIQVIWLVPATILLGDVGTCLLGTFLGAIPGGRESLLTVLLFPLLVPCLLAGISLMAICFGSNADPRPWLGLICAFDLIFLGCGLLLFPALYRGES